MPSILIVDDDEIVAEHTANVLMQAGYACGWLGDAGQALASIKWRRPMMLLLDHDMPGMSGREFLRELRKSPQFYDLPVIMFTAMSGAHDEEQARFCGAQDYVRKPVDPKFLLLKVRQVLAARNERPGHLNLSDWLDARTETRKRERPGQKRYC